MSYFDKIYHPPGTPPGTLIGTENASPEKPTIRLIDYTETSLITEELSSGEEIQPYLEKESVTWVHLQGEIQIDTLKHIGHIFELHPLALEDVINQGQRPKVEDYDDLLFVIVSMPREVDGKIIMEQVSLFLGESYIISLHSGRDDPFDSLRSRLLKKTGRIRQQKADYLLYCILDLVIDQGYPLLEKLGEDIETVEDQLLGFVAKQSTLAEIHRIRRELMLLRRNLWPQREVLNNLQRNETSLVREDSLIYLRDCYDHTIQILDIMENYREMAASLIDVYLSSVSNRLNEIMRVLTMIATIFIPLTFVVGLYGMNFNHPDSPWAMPELRWYYGYPLVWTIMISVVIGMVFYFKRKKWL